MFKKLQIKLTVFNLIILILFSFVFSAFIYFPMSHIIKISSQKNMRHYATQIQTLYDIPPIKNTTEGQKFPYNYIVILRDPLFDITATNTENVELLIKTQSEISKLDNKHLGVYSKLKIQDSTFRVFTTYVSSTYGFGQKGVVQICQDLRFEKSFLNNLLQTIVFIGFVSIALLAAISWVIAQKSLKPIRESWEKQKRFIADASHELRTPLAIMKANLEIPLIEKEGTLKDHYIWIKNAYDETDNMSHIVNALLDLTKIDSEQLQSKKKKIHLSQLVTDTLHRMQPLFNEKSIHLYEEINGSIYMNGNDARINQLLTILLDNALKYTPKGHVKVKLENLSDKAELTVSDTGIGIHPEDIHLIFDRFYRGDKTRSRSEGSLGLGLSIAQCITNEHHGIIEVKSQYSEGSTFRILLPTV